LTRLHFSLADTSDKTWQAYFNRPFFGELNRLSSQPTYHYLVTNLPHSTGNSARRALDMVRERLFVRGYAAETRLVFSDTQMEPGCVLIANGCVLFEAVQKFGHQTDEEHGDRRSDEEAGPVIHDWRSAFEMPGKFYSFTGGFAQMFHPDV
jgi:hypothetical protein